MPRNTAISPPQSMTRPVNARFGSFLHLDSPPSPPTSRGCSSLAVDRPTPVILAVKIRRGNLGRERKRDERKRMREREQEAERGAKEKQWEGEFGTIAFPLVGFLSSYRNSIDTETNFIPCRQPCWRNSERICEIEPYRLLRSVNIRFCAICLCIRVFSEL